MHKRQLDPRGGGGESCQAWAACGFFFMGHKLNKKPTLLKECSCGVVEMLICTWAGQIRYISTFSS